MHCPATLLLASAPADEGGVTSLVEQLRGELVVAVVAAPDVPGAARLAEALDTSLESDTAFATEPDDDALMGVADLHRGETVVVLTPGQAGSEGGSGVRRVELGDSF